MGDSKMRSARGIAVWKMLEEINSLTQALRFITYPRVTIWNALRLARQFQRDAKSNLKLIRSLRLFRDGRTDEALNLYWNGDDVSKKEYWDLNDTSAWSASYPSEWLE